MREVILQNEDGLHIVTLKLAEDLLDDMPIIEYKDVLYVRSAAGEAYVIYTSRFILKIKD